jgi:ubiquinone/menaquinone biosynthesis C-methylase UbiE
MESVAPANEETKEAWGGVLFDRWLAFRDVVATTIAPFSERAIAIAQPKPGDRVLDIGCGLGDTTTRLAEVVGAEGEVLGVDVGERFVEFARNEAAELGIENVAYRVADAQIADLGEGLDHAFSRFGTMFFAAPVPALRNIRGALRPGGGLCMIVWRRKLDNDWLHRGELVVNQFLEKPEETDEPTCGPGPFSMANADTVTEQLVHAGFDDIALHRHDIEYRMGDDLSEAMKLVMAIGPAGELIRLAGDEADKIRPQIEAALREAYAELERPDGLFAPASVWIITATNPEAT